jgi:hypothetical protein
MSGIWKALAILGWTALLFVISVGVADAVMAPAPASRQPDFIDTILASRAVVVAIRVAIIFAVMFVVLSVVALIARRQWLTRIGPVEVEGVANLVAESGGLDEHLTDAYRAIETLEERVAYTQQLIDGERK